MAKIRVLGAVFGPSGGPGGPEGPRGPPGAPPGGPGFEVPGRFQPVPGKTHTKILNPPKNTQKNSPNGHKITSRYKYTPPN